MKKLKAVLTVEASLIIPIVLFGILFFIHMIKFSGLQMEINRCLNQSANDLAGYAYAAGVSDQTDQVISVLELGSLEVIFRNKIDKQWFNGSIITGGSKGISLIFSSVLENEEELNAVAVYKIRIPIPFISFKNFSVAQKVKVRAFTGLSCQQDTSAETNQDEAEQVYITETGTVYHKSLECTHLKLSIREVRKEEIQFLRNDGGGKYYLCESCGKKEEGNYYITNFGDRYHTNIGCSGLKRTIKTILISEVGSRTLCKRCGSFGSSKNSE